MKQIKTMKIGNAIIDVWQDDDGNIILGGINWYEYNDYEKLKETEKLMQGVHPALQPIKDLDKKELQST